MPENVVPSYYDTPHTNVSDPCNSAPDHLENWSIGDALGLDNDGDGSFDADDFDCRVLPSDIRTVSSWGLPVLALLSLTGMKIRLGPRGPIQIQANRQFGL